jgi:hypothetical protein
MPSGILVQIFTQYPVNIKSQKSYGSTINPWLSAFELAGKAE